MSEKLDIVISAKAAAKTELDATRKEVKRLEKAIAEANDEAARDELSKAYVKASKAADDAAEKFRKASREVQNSTNEAKKYESTWDKVNKTLTKHQTAIRNTGIATGIALGYVIKKSIDAASSLQETTSKTSAVFGEQTSALDAWARSSATMFGQSRQQALEAASTYGNLFQAFGLDRTRAAEMSMDLTTLASDLASFNDTSVADALQAIQSGVSGETEPLKRYGVALTDVRLRAEAASMEIYSGVGVLDAAQRAQAAYSLILKDTSLAQGDFARTSDSLANSQRTAQAELQDTYAAIGEDLIPVATQVTKIFGTLVMAVSAIPDPLRLVVLAVAAIAAGLMIALPRILTITAATKAWTAAAIENAAATSRMGKLSALGGAAMGAIAGPAGLASIAIAGLTAAAVAYFQAQANAKQAAEDFLATLDEVAGKATEATYGFAVAKIMEDLNNPEDRRLLEEQGITIGALAAAAVDGGDAYEAMAVKIAAAQREVTTNGGNLTREQAQLNAALGGAASSLENQRETAIDAATAYDALQEAQAASSVATQGAARSAKTVADANTAAADAAERAATAQTLLASAFDAATSILDRSTKRRALAQAKADFAKDPTGANAEALTRAGIDYAATFKKPEKQLKIIEQQFPDIAKSIEKSDIGKKLRSELLSALEAIETQAKDTKTAMDRVTATKAVADAVASLDANAGPVTGNAAGGLITGPGTGTSDSILRRVSNGEYVIRAAAVEQIGVNALDRLNWADRLGVGQIALPAAATLGRDMPTVDTPSAPVIVIDGGGSGPLVGQMTVHANSGVDMQFELAAVRRREERAQRTRYARIHR